MKQKHKQKIYKALILFAVLLLITILLSLVLEYSRNGDKIFLSEGYIIEKETEYFNDKGMLPFINLKGEEIEAVNNEILSAYYSVVTSEIDEFQYEYYMYENILSVFVITTHYDNTEYGNIKYYSYNIDIKQNKLLDNNELYNYLNIEKDDINDIIDERINKYFKQDSMNQEVSYEEYKKLINYNEENIKLVLKDDILYCYYVFALTKSLTEYDGNINKIELKYLY